MNKIAYWLESLSIHGSSGAPVLIVATFLDQYSPSDIEIQELNEFLQGLEIRSKMSLCVSKSGSMFFSLNNVTGDGIEAIRSAVISTTFEINKNREPVPLKLLYFFEELLNYENNSGIMSLEDCYDVYEKLFATHSHEVEDMLLQLSEIGLLIFFSDNEILKQFVILQPNELFKTLARVFVDLDLHVSKEERDELKRSNLWNDFREGIRRSILSKDLLHLFLRTAENKDYIIEILKKALIISVIKIENEEYFTIPSVSKDVQEVNLSEPIVLRITCSTGFGIFERITCAIINVVETKTLPTLSENHVRVEGNLAILDMYLDDGQIFVQVKDSSVNIPGVFQSVLQKLNGDLFKGKLSYSVNLFNTRTESVLSNEEVALLETEWFKNSTIGRNISCNFENI